MMIVTIQFVALVDRVAAECQVERSDILGRSRRAEISDARAIALYCTRRRWGWGYVRLGELFGRTHATALYLDNKIKNVVGYDRRVTKIVDRILEEAA